MKRWLRDLMRGYSDADVESAKYKIDGLLIVSGKPECEYLALTKREWRAFAGESMRFDDGLRRHGEGFYLAPIVHVFLSNRRLGQFETSGGAA